MTSQERYTWGSKGDLESPSGKKETPDKLYFSKHQLEDIEALLRDIEQGDLDYAEQADWGSPDEAMRVTNAANASNSHSARQRKLDTDDIHAMHVKNAKVYREMQRAELQRSLQARKAFRKQQLEGKSSQSSALRSSSPHVSSLKQSEPAPKVQVHSSLLDSFIEEQLALH